MTDQNAVSSPNPGSVSPSNAAQLLRSRISRVCVAIAATTPKELMEKAREAARENSFLEFRLDYLPQPAAAIALIHKFLRELGEVTAIATCRREPGGGKFKGSIEDELTVLEQASKAGCHLVDVEIETVEKLKAADLDRIRSWSAALLISSHDFKATRDLDRTFEKILRYRPDFIKIVATATCLADNLTMMHFLERAAEVTNVVGICMGEQGTISRILGVRAGSAFTFASVQAGEETGPGQITARMLHELFRIDQVSPSTRVYGVVGNPVSHSLSPLVQNLAFRRETFNGVFLALQATSLSDVLQLIKEVPLHGLSVTMPFKTEILKHLANTDALSGRIGACNTVVRAQDGKLYGFNTDVAGIVRPLERRLPLRGAHILVLGAGGAARAAVFALKDKEAEVFVTNRTHEKALKLARDAKAKALPYEQLAKHNFDVIVNATPIGMVGNPEQSWLTAEQLNTRLVFDMVYNPIETPLLRMARKKGLPVITGLEMFVQQAARQFEIWTGKPAPEEEMLRAVIHALRQRSDAEQTSLTDELTSTRKVALAPVKAEAATEPEAHAKASPQATATAPEKVQKAAKKPEVATTQKATSAKSQPTKAAAQPLTAQATAAAATAPKATTHKAAAPKAKAKPALDTKPVAKELTAKKSTPKKPAPKAKPAKPEPKSKPQPQKAASPKAQHAAKETSKAKPTAKVTPAKSKAAPKAKAASKAPGTASTKATGKPKTAGTAKTASKTKAVKPTGAKKPAVGKKSSPAKTAPAKKAASQKKKHR